MRWRSRAGGLGGLVHVQDRENYSLNNPGPSGEGEGVTFKVKRICTVYVIFQFSSISITLGAQFIEISLYGILVKFKLWFQSGGNINKKKEMSSRNT